MVGGIIVRFLCGDADKSLEGIGEIRAPERPRFITCEPYRPPTEDDAGQDRHDRTENQQGGQQEERSPPACV
jgi:hypothetical protein